MSNEQSTVGCLNCKGSGEKCFGTPPDEQIAPCPDCEGAGEIGPDSTGYEWHAARQGRSPEQTTDKR